MTVISPAEVEAWRARLAGSAHAETPIDVFEASLLRLSGIDGLHRLSNLGFMDAKDPDAFEAALVRVQIGELILFSTLETPHTVTYDRHLRDDVDIVIIGRTGLGGQRLRTPTSLETMSVGRLGFMSSLAPSAVEHVGLTETTGVVVPVALIASHLPVIDRGVGLLPDSALSRVAGATFARLLLDLLAFPEQRQRSAAAAETAMLGLVRGLLQQFGDESTSPDRIADMRAAALHSIERRYSDPRFGVDDIAADLHISRRQLYRYFTGAPTTVSEALLHRRLLSAQESLLRAPPRDIESIASASGFPDAASLRAQFHRRLGVSPTEFRRAGAAKQVTAQAMLLTDEQAPDPSV